MFIVVIPLLSLCTTDGSLFFCFHPACRLDIISFAAEITDKVHFILPLFPNATVIRIADGHYSDIHIIATCSQFIVYDVFCQMRLFNPLRYKSRLISIVCSLFCAICH